ncbi:E3 ubiquitin-protein ligase RNF31 isoform X2 [Melanotaenia boesemani]|uniref:E3 ubiquitin-protein ligase RNF31 isoform X2 n=1 Tax=Melanotaenia boesemani TaxID=1250792 RepID=UPI001C059B8B|nr:E3 ubiquitin-protein ligase RNF31 isoform X2 [Melanotaenia boesemani]
MSSLSEQLQDVRTQAEVCLYSGGRVVELRTGVVAMANLPLPPCSKYRHIAAETMIMENSFGSNRKETLASLQRLSTVLNILEKYGCNLTNPSRPKYWRTVKHNNPVFKATVDAIQGGRAVLCLYGYSYQQPDGLSFPDDITDPDVGKVAAVTLEVMSLRMELEMLIKEAHPHPEFYERIIPTLRHKDVGLNTDAVLCHSSSSSCHPDSQTKSLAFPLHHCSSRSSSHSLSTNLKAVRSTEIFSTSSNKHPENCTICGIFRISAHCLTCLQGLCSECDRLYHSYPERANHRRTAVTSSSSSSKNRSSGSSFTWCCLHCTKVNSVHSVLCEQCEHPRLESNSFKVEECQAATVTEWHCKSCTMVNATSSILCEVCERPRLATRPPVTPSHPPVTPPRPPAPVLGMPGDPDSQWVCQFCTYLNYSPATMCEMCDLARPEPAPLPVKLHPPSPVRRVPALPIKPKELAPENLESWRQKLMKEEGLKLIQLIRDGEKKGVSPEEVYTSMRVAGRSSVLSRGWLKTELPLLLDQIRLTVATSSFQCVSDQTLMEHDNTSCNAPAEVAGEQADSADVQRVIQLSRAEAKQAWLNAGGDSERAARQALRDRLAKVKELSFLGFSDETQCHEVLRQSGGEVRGALTLLQRPLLEPFNKRIWNDKPDSPVDIHHPDKQRTCRRLLAVYDLPSWGRCELALSLLLEQGASYSLEDVVQAVRESHDREFIKRVLAKECPICLSVFPHSKMQSLTSCQCSVCCGCFQQHFTIVVRDKHIRDMVCPVCWEPDINDPEHLNSYFSTLDIQLRECLEPEVYELFHKKLTEQALIKDPKFLWCCHCSYGFIYDGDQLKVSCFQCRNSFCAQCKKPWEPQHAGLSCDQYQSWKRENDPEYQRQGLAGYLRDNGITCPNCRFQYALSKGGCMHFCCSQCRYQFCSGCNNPFHTTCAVDECSVSGLHAHHPRDCLFYLRDWEPSRLQALLQNKGVDFNTEPPPGTQTGLCGVIEQKDEGGKQSDSACGAQTQPGHAALCEKHYREYLVSLINSHSIDPAPLYSSNELLLACRRYKVDDTRRDGEDTFTYCSRLLKAHQTMHIVGLSVHRLQQTSAALQVYHLQTSAPVQQMVETEKLELVLVEIKHMDQKTAALMK